MAAAYPSPPSKTLDALFVILLLARAADRNISHRLFIERACGVDGMPSAKHHESTCVLLTGSAE